MEVTSHVDPIPTENSTHGYNLNTSTTAIIHGTTTSTSRSNPLPTQELLPRHVVKRHQIPPPTLPLPHNMSTIRSHTHTTEPNPSHGSFNGASFRPTLPLGCFWSVTKAKQFAKILQHVWDHLTFQVGYLIYKSYPELQIHSHHLHRHMLDRFNVAATCHTLKWLTSYRAIQDEVFVSISQITITASLRSLRRLYFD